MNDLDTPTTRLPAVTRDPLTAPLPIQSPPAAAVLDRICPPADLLPRTVTPAPMSLADYIRWRRTDLRRVDDTELRLIVDQMLDDLAAQYGDVARNGTASRWFQAREADSA